MKPNLEMDLYRSLVICEKCQQSEQYAEALYAALCNMQWEYIGQTETELWTCSWRYSGGIIARIVGEGDYMDWYCSGNEGTVSEEIAADLLSINWKPVEYDITTL